jgi:hypothetical protein
LLQINGMFGVTMFRNWLYYEVKPLVPWFVRIKIRRWFATKQRERFNDSWPIMPGSERPPEG